MNSRLLLAVALFSCFQSVLADLKNAHHMTLDDLGVHLIAQDGRDPRRKQVRSLDQTSLSQMSGIENVASACGDFALNNILLITQALKKPGTKDTYLSLLTSSDHAAKLFGVPSSPWNITIMKERFKSTAREIFRQQVLNCLAPHVITMEYPHDPAQDESYNYIVSVAESLDPHEIYHPEIWEDGLRYTAQKSAVYGAMIERMTAISKNGSSQTGSRDVYSTSALDTFFYENVSVDFTIKFDGTIYAPIKQYDRHRPKKKIDCVPSGRWIQTGEMPHLIQTVKQSSPAIFSDIIIDTYGGDIAEDYDHAFATEGMSNLYKAIRSSKNDCIGGILIYISSSTSFKTKAQGLVNSFGSWVHSWFSSAEKTSYKSDFEAQRSRDNGHWIAFVVARLKGSTNYYVADSLANVNRLRDPIVNELIAIFDGDKDLPGYDTTQKELERKQDKSTLSNNRSFLSGIIGAGITGALAYCAYSYYKNTKKTDEEQRKKKS